MKLLVAAWQGGAANHGFALRGTGGGASVAIASSKETGIAPKLVVTYSVPADNQPMPDLGDAPDSTNSAGAPMLAYAGTPASFPTVWSTTPPGQPAGPRHANQTYEGMLGDALSRENEADAGPDQDGVNNIQPAAGNPNNDRADDGWRNRNASFAACQRTTLVVRVTRLPGATLPKMYLNVWFDGNRDGDWADVTNCTQEGQAFQGQEWIVQDLAVNMAAIPAGGFTDLSITTERVLNTAAGPHWMRFTLSETPAVKVAGRADGRGPNPPTSFSHGETEDYLQRPQPAGADGVLALTKTSSYQGGVLPLGSQLTFEVKLRHTGGSQPVQAAITDLIPYPLTIVPTQSPSGPVAVEVLSSTGGAAPLTAQTLIRRSPPGVLVIWGGTLAPDSEVTLRFKVRAAAYCAPNQQAVTLTNAARAAKQGGDQLTAETSFTVACPGFDRDDVTITQSIEPVAASVGAAAPSGAAASAASDTPLEQPLSPTAGPALSVPDLSDVRVRAFIVNRHTSPFDLSVFAKSSAALASTDGPAAPDAAGRRVLSKMTLGPGETVPLEGSIKFDGVDGEVMNDLSRPDDLTLGAQLGYCLLLDPDGDCPDETQFPQMVGYAPPITVTVKPYDLGDAPDSSNHAGAAMLAYPAVPARYPTVFDPATGLPQGPSHARPKPFHLGQRVSLEVEADQGLDQDPSNNIVPAANTPNRDRFDDGANPSAWPLAACQTAVVPVRVFVSPAAAAWFATQPTPAYLNIWVDGNRDGDWEDGTTCPSGAAALEHLVIDHPVNAAALGAGLHTINVPTGFAPWPANLANQPAWVRVTLSEAKSVKPLTFGGIAYGDGRGPAQGFRTGETEDYILRRDGAAGAGPDLQLEMQASSQRRTPRDAVALDGAASMGEPMDFSFDLSVINAGTRPAASALLEFQIPEKLRGLPVRVVSGQGAGDPIPTESFSFNFDRLGVRLPAIAPGARNKIMLGWYGCITCTVAAASAPGADYTATARLTLRGRCRSLQQRGDGHGHDGAAAADHRHWDCGGRFRRRRIERRSSGDEPTAVKLKDVIVSADAVTSRSAPLLRGLAEPNSSVQIIVDGKPAGAATADANGMFQFRANLEAGLHRISARYPLGFRWRSDWATSRSRCSGCALIPDLPFDPVSLTFTDAEGQMLLGRRHGQ